MAWCAACTADNGLVFPQGWAAGPALPEPVQEPQAAVLGGMIYVAGGFDSSNAVSNRAYRLDPAAGQWARPPW